MAVALRLTHAQFLAAVKNKYGMWMSKNMKAASSALETFEVAKSGGQARVDKEESAMIGAWYVWSSTKEFRSVDTKTNGVCKMLAVEMGAMPDVDRESRTTAFVLQGETRHAPTAKKSPAVTVTKLTVPAYMDERMDSGGVVLIDAFGDAASPQAHGFHRKYGNQESTVMENITDVLTTAVAAQMPVFNVTMGAAKTWKQLTDKFPVTVVDIVKPAQPLFMGKENYVADTLRLIRDCEVDYLVVMGWDANQCVAAAIFGVEPVGQPFVPGLVDYGWDVVTSRNLLGANLDGQLESKWGWPHIGPA